MSKNFSQFKQQIDQALSLVESASVIKEQQLPQLNSDQLVDTQSLLNRCEQVCDKHKKEKPTIRVIQNLSYNASKLITECVSIMPNVYLLRDIYPFSDNNFNDSTLTLSDIPLLIKHAEVPNQKKLAEKIFQNSIDEVYNHVESIGGTLILLLPSYMDFNVEGKRDYNNPISLLESKYNIISVMLACNPIELYTPLIKKENAGFNLEYFNSYFKEMELFINDFSDDEIFSIENLVVNPIDEIKRLTNMLSINYDDMFEGFCLGLFDEYERYAKAKGSEIEDKIEIFFNSIDDEISKNINQRLSKFGINFLYAENECQVVGMPLSLESRFNVKEYIKQQNKAILVVAGMRHSGSTALFNILRLAIEKSGLSLFSGYSEVLDLTEVKDKKVDVVLIKTHEMRDDIKELSNVTITTVRDLRDSVSSAKRRKFAMLDKVGGVIEYAKYNRLLHDIWQPYSNFEFNYERFMLEPKEVIKEILYILGLNDVSCDEIFENIVTLPTDNYKVTLLSSTHITDPERKENYKSTLLDNDISKISSQHSHWLNKYGYQL